MAIAHEAIQIDADPERVWELAGDPARIAEWVPGLASAMAEGDERRCALEDGGELVERIIEHSDADRFHEYEIIDAPVPLRSYRSRLTVHAHDGHAHVDWIAEFGPQQPGREEQLAEPSRRRIGAGSRSFAGGSRRRRVRDGALGPLSPAEGGRASARRMERRRAGRERLHRRARGQPVLRTREHRPPLFQAEPAPDRLSVEERGLPLHERVDGRRNEAAAWYYPDPSPAAAEIKDRVAFRRGVRIVEVDG